MLKKLMIGLGLLVVVVAVGVFFLAQNAPKIVQGVIEDQGSLVTKVPVKVAAVDLSLTDLTAGIRGLTVGNPSGFKTDRAISLGEVSVKINKDTTGDLVVVDEVMIRAPEITYEIGSNGSNIAAIQSNVENFVNAMGGGSGSSEPAASAPSDGKEGPKVVISNLYIKGGQINISSPFMAGKTLSSGLPDIHLKDIGKDSGGASPAEVAQKIISSITNAASGAASKVDLSALGLSDISGKAADVMKNVGGAVGDVGGAAGAKAKDAMSGAGGAIKGLFGK